MNIGIDKISFYAPNNYIEMRELAQWRGVDPDKFTIGLGQDQMAIVPHSQDTVTLAANAAYQILDDDDRQTIDLVLLGTETGLDHSKAAALQVHRLLKIQPKARCLELKEACYATTGAMQLAKAYVAMNPTKKVLVLASDISRYGLKSSGEPTQGAGAVAMTISANPRVMVLDNEATYFSDDIYDFWRPNYSDVALVDGKYSNEQYQRFFKQTFNDFCETYQRGLDDFKALCFHIPYTKIGLKALQSVAEASTHAHLFETFKTGTTYNRRVGNIYTGSLFLSLISLLDSKTLKANDKIGFFSYGSGAVGEFFSGTLVAGYEKVLYPNHQTMLDKRTKLSESVYTKNYMLHTPSDGSRLDVDITNDDAAFVLEFIENHIRYYKDNTAKK